jgi:hypothetical protein
VDNYQIGVFLAYVNTKGDRLLIDRKLYLPKDSTAPVSHSQILALQGSVSSQRSQFGLHFPLEVALRDRGGKDGRGGGT